MKKKIMIFMLLFAFLVGMGVPAQAKADTTEDIKRYSDVNEYMRSLGLNLPEIELQDNCKYIFFIDSSNYYNIVCLESYECVCAYTGFLSSRHFDYSVYNINFNLYKLSDKNLTDYINSTWNISNLSSNYISNGLSTVCYSDINLYGLNLNSVAFYRNNYLIDIPEIPENFINDDYTIICGRYSVMRKTDADKPFLLIGSGTPILSTSDRAIAYMSDAGGYTSDMDLYLVDDFGNWYLANEDLASFGATDKTGFGVEYAPIITYTNKDIYFQDDAATDVTASSEVWVSAADFIEPYTFKTWCTDAALTCAASSNETEDLYSFSYEPENYHYIVRKNRISGSEYTWYLSQVTLEDDLIYYSTSRALADSYIGAAALYVLSGEYASGSTKVCNYVYDSLGGGWLYTDNYGVDLGLTNDYYVDDIGISFSSSMPIIYSSTDIYSDKEQSSVYYAANTEYENPEVVYPDISPTSTPTPTPISNSGSSDLGGNVVAGGGIDFIISIFSLIWSKIASIPMYVDGFQITIQQLYVYGALVGIVGGLIIAFIRRK